MDEDFTGNEKEGGDAPLIDLNEASIKKLIARAKRRGVITVDELNEASADDPRVAERFELYACGVELANGFGELTDPVEQRKRLVEAMDEKEKRYGRSWPIDEDFLAALAHMPPASGVALGFDRLVMLATGARHINDVLWTPG